MLDFVVVQLLLQHTQPNNKLAVVVEHEALAADHLYGLSRDTTDLDL